MKKSEQQQHFYLFFHSTNAYVYVWTNIFSGWPIFFGRRHRVGYGRSQELISRRERISRPTSFSSVQFSSVQYIFGLDFIGYYFISSIIIFKVQYIVHSSAHERIFVHAQFAFVVVLFMKSLQEVM